MKWKIDEQGRKYIYPYKKGTRSVWVALSPEMQPMKRATPKARALLAKLTTLAARGIGGERDVARVKLARLKKRYDFSVPGKIARGSIASLFAVLMRLERRAGRQRQ